MPVRSSNSLWYFVQEVAARALDAASTSIFSPLKRFQSNAALRLCETRDPGCC